MLGSLNRYILKTAFAPLSISLLVAALLLMMEQMLRLLDFVLNESGPVEVVWRMLAFLVPHYLGLALPLSLFMGVALAFRRLALSSEIDTMLATGVSHWRILQPLYLYAGVMMALNFLLLAYIQPYAQYGYEQLRYELQAGLLGARIPVGDFVSLGRGVKIRIGETHDNGAVLKDIFLDYRDPAGNKSTFTATRGRFMKSAKPDAILLRLENGRQMLTPAVIGRPSVLNFDLQDINIDLPKVREFRARGGEKREATINELLRILGAEDPETVKDYSAFRASFHFRLIHTLTFLSIPLMAAAFGLTNRRRPSNFGPVIGIAVVILYHEILEEWAETSVANGDLSPFIAMWPVFAVFSLFAFWLFHSTAENPANGGLRNLETGWIYLRDKIARMVRRREGAGS